MTDPKCARCDGSMYGTWAWRNGRTVRVYVCAACPAPDLMTNLRDSLAACRETDKP